MTDPLFGKRWTFGAGVQLERNGSATRRITELVHVRPARTITAHAGLGILGFGRSGRA